MNKSQKRMLTRSQNLKKLADATQRLEMNPRDSRVMDEVKTLINQFEHMCNCIKDPKRIAKAAKRILEENSSQTITEL